MFLDRPLRPRARRRVLKLRGSHHPGRDQALLPRPHLVGARAARPPGAGAARRQEVAELSTTCAASPRCRRSRGRRGTEEQVLEALQASGANRATSLSTPRGTRTRPATRSATRVAGTEEGFGAGRGPRHARPAAARGHPARARGAAPALRGGPHPGEIGRRIGVSQMQASRIIRQLIARLRTAARTGADDAPR